MKKFICVVPLQPEKALKETEYDIVGNTKIKCEKKTRFPIIPLISSYVEKGEEFRVVAVNTDYYLCKKNLEYLQEELTELCKEKGIVCSNGVETIDIPYDERVANHTATFQKLIEVVDDDDELFACITYGSKPTPIVEMMALQYAYRIKRNASIVSVIYGQLDHETNKSNIFDVTALIQLDEIVRLLAERGVTNPKETIDRLLNF